MTLGDAPPLRSIRSYVRREGRMTAAQARALQIHLPRFELATHQNIDLDAEFGRVAPVYLEIGSGNGDFLYASAAGNPAHNYLGIEVHRPGIGHLLNQAAAADLLNLRVVVRDVRLVLPQLPTESLSAVYIFFPDPWPKVRHHKRRLVQPAFLAALRRCLRRNGRVYIATDSADYALDIANQLDAQQTWLNLAGRGVLAPRLKARVCTRFEARALSSAGLVHDFVLARAD